MNVRVRHYGQVHCLSFCDDCDFTAGMLTPECKTVRDVRNAIVRHIRKTGHSVVLEIGTHSRYVPESPEKE